MQVLEFVFSGFWVFLGTLILATALTNGVAEIIRALKGN